MFLQQIGDFFLNGGFWMWPILGLQVMSFALIFDRWVSLFGARRFVSPRALKQMDEEIRRGSLDRAVSDAVRHGTALRPLVEAGVKATQEYGGKEEIQLRMDEVLMEESSRLETRLGFLQVIANVATLTGLLGTIIGLIQTFSSLALQTGAEKNEILSQGISVALNTTAYGLMVAVPAVLAYSLLQNRANQLREDLEKASLKLYIALTYKYEPVALKKNKRVAGK